MKNYVVDNYENYKEENRLTTNNARRIEFITTVRIMDELFEKKSKILDCAAGTGIYAFYLADRGHQVTATDITPRHIQLINDQKQNKEYEMETAVLDATDMSLFEDESFDVVLNMGPFDYSGSPAHPGRSSAQPDRASAHLIRSAVQLMPVADQHTC